MRASVILGIVSILVGVWYGLASGGAADPRLDASGAAAPTWDQAEAWPAPYGRAARRDDGDDPPRIATDDPEAPCVGAASRAVELMGVRSRADEEPDGRVGELVFDLVDDLGPVHSYETFAFWPREEGSYPHLHEKGPSIRLDADGRVHLPCPAGSVASLEIHSCARLVEAQHRLLRKPEPLAVLEFSPLFASEVRDLGTIGLASDPVLASGRVVDETGRPAGEAWITVRVLPDDSEVRSWEIEVRADAAGTFTVRASPREGCRYEIAARTDDRAAPALTLEPERRDVVIRLVRTGRITGRLGVRGLATLSPCRSLRLESEDGHHRTLILVRQDGTFRRDDVLPGAYSLAAELFDQDGPARCSLTVVGGETTVVDDLTLPGEWGAVVRVVSEDGAPLPDSTVLLEEDRASSRWNTDEFGRAEMPVRTDRRRWTVIATCKDFEEGRVADAQFPVTVTLKRQ